MQMALLVRVNPGKQYHLSGISWRGITALPESEVAKLISVRAGELFNRTKIVEGLTAVQKLYDSRGYINYTCVPYPLIDDDAATVALEMDVHEGEQFHFGELHVDGMEKAHREILLSAWQLLYGHPYSGTVANEFFNRYFRSPLPNIKPKDYSIREIDDYNRSVSYSLHFAPFFRYRVTRESHLEIVENP